MKRGIIIILFAIGFVFGEPIVFEYVPYYPTGEMGPEYFGFPLIYRTDTTWINSMSGEIYLKGLVGNLVFWGIIFSLVSLGISKLERSYKKTIQILFLVLGAFVCIIALTASAIDWRFKFDHNNMKGDYFTNELDYDKRTYIFLDKIENKL